MARPLTVFQIFQISWYFKLPHNEFCRKEVKTILDLEKTIDFKINKSFGGFKCSYTKRLHLSLGIIFAEKCFGTLLFSCP